MASVAEGFAGSASNQTNYADGLGEKSRLGFVERAASTQSVPPPIRGGCNTRRVMKRAAQLLGIAEPRHRRHARHRLVRLGEHVFGRFDLGTADFLRRGPAQYVAKPLMEGTS
jgi:hypothetical protein